MRGFGNPRGLGRLDERTDVDLEAVLEVVVDFKKVLRQVSGIKYLNQMSMYNLAYGDSEIRRLDDIQPHTYFSTYLS